MKYLLVALALLIPSQALGSELTVRDVRSLFVAMGLNPGTVKLLGDKGLHQLIRVRVSGRKGHWKVLIIEREVKGAVK